VARHVTGGNYKPQELRGNGRLSQLGNGKTWWQNTWRISVTEKCEDVMAIKGKVRILTCHKGTEEEYSYSSTLSLTSTLDDVRG
jgi:hypothetical protein